MSFALTDGLACLMSAARAGRDRRREARQLDKAEPPAAVRRRDLLARRQQIKQRAALGEGTDVCRPARLSQPRPRSRPPLAS